MLVKKPSDIRSSEITDKKLYLRRREFIQEAAGVAAAVAVGVFGAGSVSAQAPRVKLPNVRKGTYGADEKLTPYEDITTYNNFYEFGADKDDPSSLAKSFKPAPWRVKVEGLVNKPADYALEDLIKPHALEERIYRMR